MKDVKIVFIDLDGTLKDSDGKVDMDTIKSIEKLKDIGVQVILTTGRSLIYTINFANKYGGGNYLISSNGSDIYNLNSKKVLYMNVINKENLVFLDDLILKYNLKFIANTANNRYSNKDDTEFTKKKADNLSSINEDISQVVVQSYDIEAMKLFRRDLSSNTDLKISNKTKTIVEGKHLFYDVTNSDSSKGNAIKWLCNHLNIPLDRTMAIGDSINDLDMFDVCEYKVAMANADEELKKASNVETLSNDSKGVKAVLDRLYKEINS